MDEKEILISQIKEAGERIFYSTWQQANKIRETEKLSEHVRTVFAKTQNERLGIEVSGFGGVVVNEEEYKILCMRNGGRNGSMGLKAAWVASGEKSYIGPALILEKKSLERLRDIHDVIYGILESIEEGLVYDKVAEEKDKKLCEEANKNYSAPGCCR